MLRIPFPLALGVTRPLWMSAISEAPGSSEEWAERVASRSVPSLISAVTTSSMFWSGSRRTIWGGSTLSFLGRTSSATRGADAKRRIPRLAVQRRFDFMLIRPIRGFPQRRTLSYLNYNRRPLEGPPILKINTLFLGSPTESPAGGYIKAMRLYHRILPAALLVLGLARPLRSEDDKPEFGKDILPILKAHCLACHAHGQVKGELRLETVELMLKGGESGPALVKGDSAKSLLYQVVAGKDELVMPPKKNKIGATPLAPKDVELLKRWIDAGAPALPAPVVLHTEPPQWRPLPPGLNPIHSVAITPDGQFAACGRANQIFIYSLGAGGALSARLVDPTLREGGVADHDLILSLAFSPDGSQLASGGYRSIRLWRRRPAPAAATLDAGAPAAPLAASPDGKTLACAGPEHRIEVWDLATGSKSGTLAGHSGALQSLAYSPDGAQLVSGSADKTIRVWTLADKSSVSVDAGQEIPSVAFVSDGKRIAAGCGDFVIRLYAIPAAGAPWEKPKELKGHAATIGVLRPVGTGKQFLSGSDDGSLRLWNAESAKEERKMDHGAPVSDLAVQADGKRWVSAGGTGAKLWKNNGELQSTLKGDRRAQEAQSSSELTVAFEKEQMAYFKATTAENEKILAAESESAK